MLLGASDSIIGNSRFFCAQDQDIMVIGRNNRAGDRTGACRALGLLEQFVAKAVRYNGDNSIRFSGAR